MGEQNKYFSDIYIENHKLYLPHLYILKELLLKKNEQGVDEEFMTVLFSV